MSFVLLNPCPLTIPEENDLLQLKPNFSILNTRFQLLDGSDPLNLYSTNIILIFHFNFIVFIVKPTKRSKQLHAFYLHRKQYWR